MYGLRQIPVKNGAAMMKKAKPKEMYAKKDRKNLQHHEFEHMDAGIRETVKILVKNGIETTQSCQGGPGHCYPVPTIEFCGGYEAGFRAFAVAVTFGLKVGELRRVWWVQSGELVGPHWAMTFRPASSKTAVVER